MKKRKEEKKRKEKNIKYKPFGLVDLNRTLVKSRPNGPGGAPPPPPVDPLELLCDDGAELLCDGGPDDFTPVRESAE